MNYPKFRIKLINLWKRKTTTNQMYLRIVILILYSLFLDGNVEQRTIKAPLNYWGEEERNFIPIGVTW
jgi:hypothetical protein